MELLNVIEPKDLLLLVASWTIAKILDLIFNKAKEAVTKRKKKKPQPANKRKSKKRKRK